MTPEEKIQLGVVIVCAIAGTIAQLSLIPAIMPERWHKFMGWFDSTPLGRELRSEALAEPCYGLAEKLRDELALSGEETPLPFFAGHLKATSTAIEQTSVDSVALPVINFPSATLIQADDLGGAHSIGAAQILSSKEVAL